MIQRFLRLVGRVVLLMAVATSSFMLGASQPHAIVVDHSRTLAALQLEVARLRQNLTLEQSEKQRIIAAKATQVAQDHWQSVGDFSFLTHVGYLEIPLVRKFDYFEIKLQFNGQDAYLLLDTGASQTVLDRDATQVFNLPVVPSTAKREYVGLGGKSDTGEIVKVGSITLGTIHLTNIDLPRIDLSAINDTLKSQNAEAIDGLLGDDFLHSGQAVMDFEHQKIYLRADMKF